MPIATILTSADKSRDSHGSAVASASDDELHGKLSTPFGAARAAFINTVIRGLSMAGKLLFLVLAAKKLTVEQMATYALMATTVNVAVTVMGVEFYAYSIRELVMRSGAARAVCLRNQFVLYGIGYLLLLPCSVPVFTGGVLPISLYGWFIALAIGEHVSQEVNRILNAMFRPVLATIIFFIRSAAWATLVAFAWLLNFRGITVSVIAVAWLSGIILSLLVAARVFRRLDWREAKSSQIDWIWIKRGLLIAVPFMLSALASRVTDYSDRYMLHFMVGDRAVGVYSFFSSIANVLPAVIGASISTIFMPRAVREYQLGDRDRFRATIRQMTVLTALVTGVGIPAAYLFVRMLLPYVGRPEYAAGLPALAVLLFATGAGAFAQVPAIVCYAKKKDLALLGGVVIAAGTNVVLNLIFIPTMKIRGAALATLIAFVLSGLFQLVYLLGPERQPEMLCGPATRGE